jgi:WhiB family redox-sensing transcriptional regulator
VDIFGTIRWSQARCSMGDATLVSLFFSEDPVEIARAKDICRSCPLIRPCLEGAVRRREPVGVWGGELFDRGRVIDRKRPRGRPRKTEILVATEAEAEVA